MVSAIFIGNSKHLELAVILWFRTPTHPTPQHMHMDSSPQIQAFPLVLVFTAILTLWDSLSQPSLVLF